MKRIAFLCLLLVCLLMNTSFGQVSLDKGTLSGKVYSDYYWMAEHHDEQIEGKNGFWIRRIYLTYNRDLNDSFSSRVRLEMNSAGDFQTSTAMLPEVKDAYLKWQNDSHQILVGISSTPTFSLAEDVWGYRAVEKSPLDLYDFGSSRDLGLSFKGELGQAGKLNYHFFLGNGNSNRPDIDKGKKLMLSLSYDITEQLVIEGYLDLNDTADNPNMRDSRTAQIFAGYQSNEFNLGALYAYQHRDALLGQGASKLDLISVFGTRKINESVNGFLRIDHLFDPYEGGSGNAYIPFAENALSSTFIVGGADFRLEENIRLMPNIEAIIYGENRVGPAGTDVIPRLTLFYSF